MTCGLVHNAGSTFPERGQKGRNTGVRSDTGVTLSIKEHRDAKANFDTTEYVREDMPLVATGRNMAVIWLTNGA